MRAIRTTTISILALGLLAGSAVGVAAQSTVVTGYIDGGCSAGSVDGQEVCTGEFVMDDQRLVGDYELVATQVGQEDGEGFSFARIRTEVGSLTNDEGAWSVQALLMGLESDDEFVNEVHIVLTGEDAYEGLTAYLGLGPEGMQGVILEDEPME